MHKVSITPHWTITSDGGTQLSPRLLSLLADVQEHGSLSGACKQTGSSYRHAWNLIRQGQQQLGMPLLNMDRGKGSTLTPLAERLVWAGHRIQARLSPTLESLASELETELGRVLSVGNEGLHVHASHGFAVEKLIDTLAQRGERIDRKYVGSQEAVASLHAGSCDLAGFHVPQGEFEAVAFQHYAQWFSLKHSRLIHMATRRQGLFVARGNPLEIYGVNDLARKGVRFVNRQPSSGTRFTCVIVATSSPGPPEVCRTRTSEGVADSARSDALGGRPRRCSMAVSRELLDLLVCPKSKAPLVYDAERNALVCEQSQLVYRVEDDIPVLLVEEAETLTAWRKRVGLDD